MPRKSTICIHPKKKAIDKAIASGEAIRKIAEQYGISVTVLWRYANKQFPKQLAKATEVKQIADADKIQLIIEDKMSRIDKLINAAEVALQDPDNPAIYTLDPRAENIKVVYDHYVKIGENGQTHFKPMRKRETLQAILERMQKSGREMIEVSIKRRDPVDALVNGCREMRGQLELIAKLIGELQPTGVTVGVQVILQPAVVNKPEKAGMGIGSN